MIIAAGLLFLAVIILAVTCLSPTSACSTDSASTAQPPYIAIPESVFLASATEEPKPIDRYAGVTISDVERWEFASMIFLEAGNQSPEGQQAVAEVILNRVIASNFPNSLYAVLHHGENTSIPQFSSVGRLYSASPDQAQFDAIDAALYGPSILPDDVVFFSRHGENNRVWGQIGDHIFCYSYIWE